VGHDGGGREFVTTPISLDSINKGRAKKRIEEYYSSLKERTKVIATGGTHIHISILNNDHVNMESNAVALSIAFYEQFQKIAGRKSNWAQRPMGNKITEVRNFINSARRTDGVRWRYTYVNGVRVDGPPPRRYCRNYHMLTPSAHQTIEFRGPMGSNDSQEVLAWAQFLENVVKVSNRESIDAVKFRDLLDGSRIREYIKGLKGWRKITESELDRTVDVNRLRTA